MKTVKTVLLTALMTASATPCFAQAASDDATKALAGELARAEVQNQASHSVLETTGFSRADDTLPDLRFAPLAYRAPAGTAAASIATGEDQAAGNAEVSAGNDSGTATVKLVYSAHPATTDVQINSARGTADWSSYLLTASMIVSAPFDKSNESAIVSTTTLPSDFSVKIGFSFLEWDVGYRYGDMTKLHKALQEPCHKAIDKQAGADQDNSGLYRQKCFEANTQDLIANYLADDTKAKTQAAARDTVDFSAFAAGGDLSIGYQKFDFFDAVTAAKTSSTGTPWSANLYAGWLPNKDLPLMLASIAYQDKFKAATAGTLCPLPSPAPAVLTCVTGAIGVPKESQSFVTSIELRKAIPLPAFLADLGVKEMGADAKFSYDLKSDVYSFDLPLSFVADKDGGLVGGVDFGWQSDKHEFIAGLFLNSAFSLFPG